MTECTIYPEHVGTTTNLMIKPESSSSSRGGMQGAHYAQTPQVVGAEPRRSFTGFEREYAKYMFNVVVEHKCTVKAVFTRKPLAYIDEHNVLERVVFVERHDDRRTVDCIQIPLFESNHQYFGFSYILTEAGHSLRADKLLRKGLVLAECPSVIDQEFCNGVQANCVLISHPQMIEDACVISDRLCDNLLAYGYKTYRLFIGEKNIPLLPYGTPEEPAMFPHVGEKVRPDGILFGTRVFDPMLAAVECSARALREPCTQNDDCIITDKEAIVYDVKVFRDDTKVFDGENGLNKPHTKMHTPTIMQEMLDRYYDGTAIFHDQIRDYYQKVTAERTTRHDRTVPMSPLAHVQFLQSIAHNPEKLAPKSIRRKQFGKDLMDDYVIEITVKYPIPMAVSGKLTDCAGGKGIAGEKLPLEMMPYDDFGNYVDIMMSDNAVLRRTNFNRPFESYINAATRDVQIKAVELHDAGKSVEGWNYLMSYCECASPEWAEKLKQTHPNKKDRTDMLSSLRTGKMRMWWPANCIKPMDVVEHDVELNFPPRRSPLTFTNKDGTTTRTEAEFIVGELYIIRLDKTGRESFSISAGRYQQFGTIAKQHSSDKNRRPVREQPIKFMGESECRHLCSYTPEGTAAELHDRSNNPVVMDAILRCMLTHETPTNIDVAVDRKKFPLGNNRSMLIADHTLECEGSRFTTRRGNLV